MEDDNVLPLDRIRRYRNEVNRRQVAGHMYRVAKILLEVSAITAIVGRGLKFMSREMGYEPSRRIRFPMD